MTRQANDQPSEYRFWGIDEPIKERKSSSFDISNAF